MRVEWAVACRHVEVHDNLGTLIGAGIDRVGVPQVPVNIPVAIAVRLAVAQADVGVEHQLSMKIRDNDMNEVAELTTGFRTDGEQVHALPGWEGHIIIPIVVVLPAKEEGPYILTVSIAGTSFDVPIIVAVNAPPPTP